MNTVSQIVSFIVHNEIAEASDFCEILKSAIYDLEDDALATLSEQVFDISLDSPSRKLESGEVQYTIKFLVTEGFDVHKALCLSFHEGNEDSDKDLQENVHSIEVV